MKTKGNYCNKETFELLVYSGAELSIEFLQQYVNFNEVRKWLETELRNGFIIEVRPYVYQKPIE